MKFRLIKILDKLKKGKMKWYNVWSWPAAVIDDIRQWRIVKKATQEAEVIERFKAFKYEMRVDKIGRIYTVINVPEELLPYEHRNQVWPWVLEQLREIDDLLLEIRLNDMLYPEVEQHPDAPAYVVKLVPPSDSISIWKFLSWIRNIAFVSLSILIINKVLVKYAGISIVKFILDLF
jgi:hypothetical protein